MASTDLRAAAKQALTALQTLKDRGVWGDFDGVADALKEALVEDAMQRFSEVNQELEAALAEHYCDTHCTWADHAPGCVMEERNFCPRCGKRANGIHTCTPPAPLTDEVIADLWHQNGGFHHHFARAIERWLKGNP